ncbi:MAG: heme lyase CcmF/NrfE family subunit [Deltaproteobacteria bacterium]|nr:heme lyase CcmF/NrfE family subunit [Deltaproteobacteria bacterium]
MSLSLASFGNIILIFSSVLFCLSAIFALTGLSQIRFEKVSRALTLSGAIAGTVSILVLAMLLLTHDYRVQYVSHNADRTMDTLFLITAVWGGQQGSLLFWAVIQSWFAVAASYFTIKKLNHLARPVIALMSLFTLFFTLLVFTNSNPFTLSGHDLINGSGMNPLLRNPYMVFHPPTLFIGFAGFSVPAAFALGWLLKGNKDDRWLYSIRPFILFAFAFLTIGNVLGMVWAYEELGWGGFWGWDPVENASLIPWITGAALVHSSMAQTRANVLKTWNIFLIAATFILVIFGTFLTRSNIIQSVHAFSGATTAPYFLGFIAALVAGFIAVSIIKRDLLKSETEIEFFTKEWFFESTNWLFTAAAVFVWTATMWPLFHSIFNDQQLSVPPEFFNTWMIPIGITLLFFLALCTVIPWKNRKEQKSMISKTFAGGVILTIIIVTGFIYNSDTLVIMPTFSKYASLFSVAVLSFLAFTLLLSIRKSLISKNRVKLGGQIVHLGILIMFIGFTGGGFKSENRQSLAPGDFFMAGEYKVTFMGLRSDVNYKREAIYGDLIYSNSEGESKIVSPARFFYHSMPNQPTSEVAIEGGLFKDLFFILGETDLDTGHGVIEVIINPLIFFIWLGAIVMITGILIAAYKDGFLITALNFEESSFFTKKINIVSIVFSIILVTAGYLFAAAPGLIGGLIIVLLFLMFYIIYKQIRINNF